MDSDFHWCFVILIKIKNGYEPTYSEVKRYYTEYLEREKRSNESQWTAIKPLTLEEYLDEWVYNPELYSNVCLFHYMTMKQTDIRIPIGD